MCNPTNPPPEHHPADPARAGSPDTIVKLAPPRTWGFRFSITDAFALAVFGAASATLHRFGSDLWWIVTVAAGHFFLFCNVFRVARRRELLWAGIFILNVGFWTLLGRLDPFEALACQLPVSAGVIAWEIKAPRYHGIFAEKLNPRLPEYLEGEIS